MATLQPPRCDTERLLRYFTGWKNLKCVIQGSSKASLLLGAWVSRRLANLFFGESLVLVIGIFAKIPFN